MEETPTLKTSSKRLRLSTQAMNSKGFRVRTEGIKLDGYNQNPLLIWDHNFPVAAKTKDAILPLGCGTNVSIENGELFVTPAFDLTDTFAESIYNKVENGTIRMASAALNPIEWIIDEKGELWLWESELIEASITPKGANPESFAVELYDAESSTFIHLSDDFIKTIKETKMPNIINLSAENTLALKLSADATPDQVNAAISAIVKLSADQATTIVTLSAERDTAKADMDKLKKQVDADRIVQLHTTEVVTNRKVTEEAWGELIKLGYDGAKSVLDKMPANATAAEKLKDNDKDAATELSGLVKLSWDELDKSKEGKLERLKNLSLEDFKAKYKERFNKEWKG